MHEINRLFEKLDTTFDERSTHDQRHQNGFFNKALILLLGISPAAAALSLFI